MGEVREIVTAQNSTVLGSKVKPDSRSWTTLDWSRVRTDHGPHAFHPEASEYLHVGAGEPDEEMQYRVRCRYMIGDKIKVNGVRYRVDTILARQGEDGRWRWVIGYKGK